MTYCILPQLRFRCTIFMRKHQPRTSCSVRSLGQSVAPKNPLGLWAPEKLQSESIQEPGLGKTATKLSTMHSGPTWNTLQLCIRPRHSSNIPQFTRLRTQVDPRQRRPTFIEGEITSEWAGSLPRPRRWNLWSPRSEGWRPESFHLCRHTNQTATYTLPPHQLLPQPAPRLR